MKNLFKYPHVESCQCDNISRIAESCVIDSRKKRSEKASIDYIMRRRQCNWCHKKFTTYELETKNLRKIMKE
jgi:transcriptional regulator NrdR family protein